jgi:hypothetical protein
MRELNQHDLTEVCGGLQPNSVVNTGDGWRGQICQTLSPDQITALNKAIGSNLDPRQNFNVCGVVPGAVPGGSLVPAPNAPPLH